MELIEHEKSALAKFGKPWTKVHVFLDQYFPLYGPYHRIIFHHRQGIALAVKKFKGQGPVQSVAEQHIIDDFGFVPADWTDPEFDVDRDLADSWVSKGTAGSIEDILRSLYNV